MFQRSARHRRLGFEGLERRELLAGNVTAGLDVNGNLVLTGDLDNNHVMVTRAFFAGQLVVQGGRSNPDDPNTQTSINGQFGSLTFSTGGGIVLDMREGNDSVLVTNLGVQGSITGRLGAGNDQLAIESDDVGLLAFTLNNGNSPNYAKASASGIVNVNGNDGNDVISLYNATIGSNLTFNGGNGADTFSSVGSDHDNNIVGGTVYVGQGNGDDVTTARRLAIGKHLFIDDGPALTQSRVGLVNIRVNLDIQMNLSIRTDRVNLLGEDNDANRFQARNVVINTGNGVDQVTVDKGIMLNVTVSTGAGNDRWPANFGARLTNLAVNDRVYVDTGDGQDTAFINNVNTDELRVYTRGGADSVTCNRTQANDALFDTGDGNDFVGLHDASTYSLLEALLGANDDVLEARGITVTTGATFNGGLGLNTYRDQGGNVYNSLTRINI